MFDDAKKEPEDIFADNEPEAAVPGMMQPSQPNQAQRAATPSLASGEEVVTSGPRRTLVIVGIIVVVLVLVLVVVLIGLWMSRSKTAPVQTNQQTPVVNQQPAVITTEPVVVQPVVTTPTEPLDTDKDGLTDEEEAALRTDPLLADTDGDALSDQEEVRVWGSDPLNKDTDGDGFEDGMEVKAGYDPNLAGGRLLDINNPPASATKP